MDGEIIFLDASLLIDYFRKTKKENSFLYKLSGDYIRFAISIITKFEILIGSNESQVEFWNQFFEQVEVIEYDDSVNEKAVEIYRNLKVKNQLIGFADLMICATALSKGFKVATLNYEHFGRIEGLELIKEQ